MTKRNSNFARLSSTYLFPEINRRKKVFLEKNPHADIISLGVGDTTEPLPLFIDNALKAAAEQLATREGYSGYGPEQGFESLRQRIAQEIYRGKVRAEDIIISDGAKCDIGRLQVLFGSDVSVAVQNPAYPVYVDGSILNGVQKIEYLPCTAENGFWPDLKKSQRTDLIYWCSPNNPTGAVTKREQLKELVAFAKANGSIIIFDAAYANYIQDANLPRSIYEIEGAQDVAIELGSFSKLAGFTGVRLGWTVVPETVEYEDGSMVKTDWKRLTSTIFNGASIISQHGGIAALAPDGLLEIEKIIQFYLENARLIKEALQAKNYEVYGGTNAPYLWAKFLGKQSWEIFQELLEKAHIITTPGSGFGHEGEGFLRFSPYGHRATILEAVKRLKTI